jgi:hydroxymethylpyrimidine/phosphomethylpyrimidine kinase
MASASPSSITPAQPHEPVPATAEERAAREGGARPVVLVVGGSDSSAGAGVQADLLTVAALGGSARTVVTAVTAQHSGGVSGSWPAAGEAVEAQLRAAFLDTPPRAIKTGMLATAEAVRAVAEAARAHAGVPLVIDPVVRSSSGAALIDESGLEAVRRLLLPLGALVTPNAAEASLLAGMPVRTVAEAEAAARRIVALGARAVVVTGGHLEGDARGTDVLVTAQGAAALPGAYLDGREVHGTGCAFASAAATRLASGDGVEAAVRAAKRYVAALIASAERVGDGALMADHLEAARRLDTSEPGGAR